MKRRSLTVFIYSKIQEARKKTIYRTIGCNSG